MFACVYAPPSPVCHPLVESRTRETLLALAQMFVPRFEIPRDDVVLLDVRGLGRILGEPRQIGAELRKAAADRGLPVHVAIAATRTAAWLLAHARAGLTCIDPGGEAAALAPLPIGVLSTLAPDCPNQVFRRWGLTTLGDLAALPAAALSERLGQDGVAWQLLARGEDLPQPLVPWADEIRFEAALELEWPIEGLEPLSFVLGRLLDPLAVDLERRDRAAAVLHLALRLVTKEVFTRSLRLPAPIRDPRVLRTLMRLDLDAHPPGAAIERVAITIEPAPGRILQESLLERARPAPEQMTTLLARLGALVGEDRCGAPVLVDSHRPGAFAMVPFSASAESGNRGWERLRPCRAEDKHIRGEASASVRGGGGAPPSLKNADSSRPALPVALRRFRRPIPVRVRVEQGCPAQVIVDRPELRGGQVARCAGPWRTSGEWWRSPIHHQEIGEEGPATRARERNGASRNASVMARAGVWGGAPWNKDEWDVAFTDGLMCRLSHDRDTKRWFIDAVMD